MSKRPSLRLFSVSSALVLALVLLSCPAWAQGASTAASTTSIKLFDACTESQAGQWAQAGTAASLTQAANCYAYLSQKEGDSDKGDKYAQAGRKAAKQAVDKNSQSGVAQYLLAVLIGYVAQDEPWYDQMSNGLDLVPEIVKHAKAAASISPKIDQGGPDRALGEVYLQAPEPPMSVGDPKKAVDHFKQALKYGPDFPLNHVNLAKALLKTKNKAGACAQLNALQHTRPPRNPAEKKDRKKGIELYDDKCR